MSRPRVHFAATADQPLRIDAARTLLFSWLFARTRGGTFILSLGEEDGGPPSAGRGAALQDLQWLGLAWDEEHEAGVPGRPSGVAGLDPFEECVEALLRDGRAYACLCAPDGCAGSCRTLARGDRGSRRHAGPLVIRFDSAAALAGEDGVRWTDLVQGEIGCPAESIDDFVLVDRAGRPAPGPVRALDDRALSITHVIRSDAGRPETARQLLIHRALGGGAPAFAHLPIILDAGGAPPGESGAADTIAGLRRQGYPVEAVINLLALLGWSAPGRQELLTLEELVALFDLARVDRAPVLFDRRRLEAIAARHMARLPPERIGGLAAEQLAAAGLLPERPPREALEWAGHLAMLYAERLPRMQDLVTESAFLFDFDPLALRSDPRVRDLLDDPQACAVARAVGRRLGGEPLTAPRFHGLADEVRRATGARGRALYDPIRLALTGAAAGPELVRLLPVIEEGSRLSLPRPIASCVDRARALCAALPGEGS